jgi:DNA polymerase-3 subunit alpha
MDGFGQPVTHVNRVADLGMSSLALTEHGNVSSHVRHQKACDKAGIKPIYGAELYTGPTAVETRRKMKWHLGVIALDVPGYQNLMKIVTESWGEGFYYEPTVSGESLAQYGEGLAVLSGCTGSLLACTLVGGKGTDDHAPDIRAAGEVAARFRELLGDRYFLEVQAFPKLGKTCAINPAYERLGKKLGIPLVATCDVHYPFPDDNEMQVILHAAGRGNQQFDVQAQSWEYDVRLTYPKSDKALYKKLIGTGLSPSAARGAIGNAASLAERARVRLPRAERLRFPLPEGFDSAYDYLFHMVMQGWRYRGFDQLKPGKQKRFRERIDRELGMITDKDFADFFIATADVIQWTKNSGISVGPARGSAAASLVCYLLRITEINPMRYPMMMLERFIDPARPDPPDIDLDFDDERREEIRQYLMRKYGEDNVGNIGNFIRYRGKNSLVDAARVYRVPRFEIAAVNDLVAHRSDGDMRLDSSLSDTVDSFPAAQAVFDKYPDLKAAFRLEGNMRGMSVHAAGLVVGTRPITDVTALYTRNSGTGERRRELRVLACDKYDAEYLDFLKMDFLGLTTMGMISHALELAGLDLENLYSISDKDEEVMAAFSRNDVIGIFQFEGRATRIVNRNVKPERFMDLADINALSRPGPLFSGTTTIYTAIRWGREKPEALHPAMDKITAGTRGQIIYQEQIIAVVREIGGFDWTDANSVRRIIAKKLGEAAFNVNFRQFADGAKRLHDIDEDLALRIWKRLVTAGTYAFNTAHSVSYAVLAWWCMWLKVYFPAEFYTASLMKADNENVTVRLLKDAAEHGISFLPPHPNNSSVTWTLGEDRKSIQAGFMQVPGIGDVTARAIVQQRAEELAPDTWGGEWKDLLKVKGIGPVTLGKIRDWAETPDPFGVFRAANVIGQVKRAILAGELKLPMPTVVSTDMQSQTWETPMGRGRKVVYCGLVRGRDYKDIIEDQRARSGREVDEIRRDIKRPDLAKFATLRCYDTGEEDVYLRFNRFHFPRFKAQIDAITVGEDAVVVVGRESKGFGAAIAVDHLWVIEPD